MEKLCLGRNGGATEAGVVLGGKAGAVAAW